MAEYLAPGQVHIGSVLDLAGRLEPQSVQTIVTSPPYFGLRSYLPAEHPDKAHELGSEATPEAFVANLVAVFAALRPALKDSATVWLNLGDSYAGGKQGRDDEGPSDLARRAAAYGTGVPKAAAKGANGVPRKPPPGTPPKSLLLIPHRVALALQADGWVIRQDVVWAKKNCMPESVSDRPTRAHEYVFLIAKSPAYFYDAEAIKEPLAEGSAERYAYGFGGAKNEQLHREYHTAVVGDRQPDPGGRNKRSVWTVATQPYPDAHYATFPPDLIRPCILAGTSERGECAACGRAWVRCVEKGEPDLSRPQSRRALELARERGLTPAHIAAIRSQGVSDTGKNAVTQTGTGRNTPEVIALAGEAKAALGGYYREFLLGGQVTTGWRPQCACPPGTPARPQIVLDPFAGSCTTWQVAHEEGRRFVGFDLDERAVEWGRQRLSKLPVGRLFA